MERGEKEGGEEVRGGKKRRVDGREGGKDHLPSLSLSLFSVVGIQHLPAQQLSIGEWEGSAARLRVGVGADAHLRRRAMLSEVLFKNDFSFFFFFYFLFLLLLCILLLRIKIQFQYDRQ